MSYKIDAKSTRQSAKGLWRDLLPKIDSRLKPAIDAAGKSVPCPLGTGTKDGFRIPIKNNDDGHAFHNQLSTSELSDGFKVLMWINGWTFYEALKAVHGVLNGDIALVKTSGSVVKTKKVDLSKKVSLFKRWINESSIEPNLPAIRYFISRDLISIPHMRSRSLRYIDSIPFLHDGRLLTDSGTNRLVTTPAILCGMRTNDQVAGLCVIRLTPDGFKADKFMRESVETHNGVTGVDIDSKQLISILPTLSGASFRLGDVGETWGIGEGVETMLAVSQALGTESLGASTTAALLENVEIPSHVKRLIIFSDKDANGRGMSAATKLMEREKSNREVVILTPESPIPENHKGIDWLDCMGELSKLKAGNDPRLKGLI